LSVKEVLEHDSWYQIFHADLICDVIKYSASSFNVRKYDKIVVET